MELLDPKNVEQQLLKISSGNNAMRKEGELFLKQLLEGSPDNYVRALLGMCRTSSNEAVQELALVTLRSHLVNTKMISSIFYHISQETKSWLIQETVFFLLDDRTPSKMRRFVSLIIAEIGSSDIAQGLKDWPDFLKSLFEWTRNKNPQVRERSIEIFSVVVESNGEYFEQFAQTLSVILENALKDTESAKIKSFAMDALATMLSSSGRKSENAKIYSKLSPLLLQLLTAKLHDGLYAEAIEQISSMITIAEARPMFFEPVFDSLTKSLFQIATTCEEAIINSYNAYDQAVARGAVPSASATPDATVVTTSPSQDIPGVLPCSVMDSMCSLRTSAIELLLNFAYSFRKRIKKNREFTDNFLKILTITMINFRPSPTWETQPDDPDDDADKSLHNMSINIDRFSKAVGGKFLLPIHFELITSLMAQTDWRAHMTALLQIAFCLETYAKRITRDQMKYIISLASQSQLHTVPRVCHAGVNVFAALFRDCQKRFTSKASLVKTVIEQCISGLTTERWNNVPTLRDVFLRLSVDIAENTPSALLKPFVESIIKAIYPYTQLADFKMKLQAVQCLEIVIENMGDAVKPFYSLLSPFLMSIVQAENVVTADDKSFQAAGIQCLGSLLCSVGKQIAAPAIEPYVTALLRIYNTIQSELATSSSSASAARPAAVTFQASGIAQPISSSDDDDRAESIEVSWTRMAELMGPRFTMLCPTVIPPLIRRCSQTVESIPAGPAQISAASIASGSLGAALEDIAAEVDAAQDPAFQQARNAMKDRKDALERLSVITDFMGPYFAPYAKEAFDVALKQLQDDLSRGDAACPLNEVGDLIASCVESLSPIPADSDFRPDYVDPAFTAAGISPALQKTPALIPPGEGVHPVKMVNEALPAMMMAINQDVTVAADRKTLLVVMNDCIKAIAPLLNPQSPYFQNTICPFGATSPLAAIPPWAGNLDVVSLTSFLKAQFIECRRRRLRLRSGTYNQENELLIGLDDEDAAQEADVEDEVLGMIDECVSTLLKIYGSGFEQGFELLMPVIFEFVTLPPPPAEPLSADLQDRVCGLFLMGDYLEYGGDVAVKQIPNFMPHYLRLADPRNEVVTKEPATRQNAICGIGICAKIGGELFAPFYAKALEVIGVAIQLPVNEEEEEELSCRDNAVSALMKVMMYQATGHPEHANDVDKMIALWLPHLPLLNDELEAVANHAFLCTLLESNDDGVLGGGDEAVAAEVKAALANPVLLPATSRAVPCLTRLFKIMINVVKSKLVDEQTDAKFIAMLGVIRKCLSPQTMAEVWETLSDERKAEVAPFITS